MSALAPAAVAVAELEPVAALPMYDFPHLQAANDALWAGIAGQLAARGVRAPRRLTRRADLDSVWRAPGLLLAQACGYPLVTGLKDAVRLVATPRYRAPGCEGPFHRSAIVVRRENPAQALPDLRGARCAVNDRASNTGMNLLRAEVARVAQGERFFGEVQLTGAHAESLRAVAEGLADVAAIDAVSLTHLAEVCPELKAEVRVLAWTRPSPGLPLVTSASTPPEVIDALREALDAAAADPTLDWARTALRLDGFNRLHAAQYRAVAHLEEAAVALGYPELA